MTCQHGNGGTREGLESTGGSPGSTAAHFRACQGVGYDASSATRQQIEADVNQREILSGVHYTIIGQATVDLTV